MLVSIDPQGLLLEEVEGWFSLVVFQLSIGAASQVPCVGTGPGALISVEIFVDTSGIACIVAISDHSESHGSVNFFPSIHEWILIMLILVYLFFGTGVNESELSWMG